MVNLETHFLILHLAPNQRFQDRLYHISIIENPFQPHVQNGCNLSILSILMLNRKRMSSTVNEADRSEVGSRPISIIRGIDKMLIHFVDDDIYNHLNWSF